MFGIRTIKLRVLQLAAQRVALADSVHGLSPEEIQAQALLEAALELLKLDGYERKARSRRKKAFRALWEYPPHVASMPPPSSRLSLQHVHGSDVSKADDDAGLGARGPRRLCNPLPSKP